MNISQGTVRPYILASLFAHGGEAPGGTVTAEALVAIGADPAVESNRQAVANARHDLKGRGCVVDGSKRGNWALTTQGRAVHGGAPLPPYVRAPKADTGKPLVEVLGEAPTPVETVEPAPELDKVETVELAPVEETPVVETPVVEPAPVVDLPAPVTVEAAPVEAPAPVTVETAPVEPVEAAPATAPKRRLKVATAVPAVVVPEWVQDESLRTMVVESTECFGLWSAKATGCGECVLAGWCRNAKAATLEVLAGKIKTETPATPEPVTKTVATLDAEVGKGLSPDAARTAPKPEEGFTIKATHDTVCGVTGAPIRKGDAVRYVRGTGLVLVK
jgi:hypothetical protein